MTQDDFEKLGELGIVEMTLNEDVYEALCDSFFPTQRSANGYADGIVQDRKKFTLNRIHTTSGEIKVNKEK